MDGNTNKAVKKGQYVQVQCGKNGQSGKNANNSSENGNETLFGYINEMFRANRYFERAESVADYEKEMPLRENFPTDSWEYTIANVRILGTHNKTDGHANGKADENADKKTREKFGRAHVPPSPGLKVQLADEKMLKKFLGFEEAGLHIGTLQHHETQAKIDLTRLFQKHVAILAMSGAGKSHLMSVLLEEMLERKKEEGRLAVIVIDIHGEYIGFGFDGKYGANTKTIEGRDVFVPLRKITPEMADEWLPLMSPAQREVLRHAMHELRADKASGTKKSLKALFEKIENSPVATKEDTKKTLKRILMELRRYRFISVGKENPKLIEDIKPGKMLVVDLSDTDSMRKKQIMVSYIARKLFRLRKKGKIPPFVLVIEEAHNFAREKAEAHEAVSRGIIETIAREGRKFGASLCLISQRPVNLSTTALSQCNTHIILRVTNPNDLDHIQMSSEGIDSRIAKSITGLQVGEAIIVGAATNHPIFVNVRDRKSQKREKGKPLHEQAIEFEMQEEKKKGDVEAFL